MTGKTEGTVQKGDDVELKPVPSAGHLEGDPKHDNIVVLKSSHDDLGLLATVWKFRKVWRYSTRAAIVMVSNC